MNELVKRPAGAPVPLSNEEIETTYRQATALYQSGMFRDVKTAGEAYARITIGRDLGLSAAASMTGIHLVEGKPMIHYSMLAAFVRQHERYDYRVREHTDEACTVVILMDGEEIGSSTFTMEDRKRANLGGKPGSNWAKYPRTMLFARALSNAVRWHAPDATFGVPTYVDGEIEESRLLNAGAGDAGDDPSVFEPAEPEDAEVIPGQTTIAEALEDEPPPGAGLPFDPDDPDA